MLTCVVSLLLVETLVLVPSYFNYVRQLERGVEASAESVFRNLQFGLDFSNFTAIESNLYQQVLAQPDVRGFSFFDATGKLLSSVGEPFTLTAPIVTQLADCCADAPFSVMHGGERSLFSTSLTRQNLPLYVALSLDSSLISQRSRSYLIRVLGLVALICLAVTGSIVLVMGRYATRIEYESNYDKLTNLPNKQGLARTLQNMVGDNQPLYLVIIDIDGFTSIRDRWGVANSDQLIQRVVERIADKIEPDWYLARVRDDKFALLIRGARQSAQLFPKLQALLDVVAEPVTMERDKVSMTACLGVFDGTRCEQRSGDEVLECADLALIHAKNDGSNQLVLYAESFREERNQRNSIITRLRNALADTELSLNYQPQYDARSGRLVGAETLMRWQSPELGSISPGVFIPLAEQTGIIVDYGAWAMEQAVKQYADWRDAGLKLPVISVNVSPRQFVDSKLTDRVARLVDDFALEAGVLELEITESAVIQSPEVARKKMEVLVALGVIFAIDDFGTGHSSLSNLGSFPFSRLKIDQSFVRRLVDSRADRCIVRSCIELAHSLGMNVVAEGVETQTEFERLVAWDCDVIQGYYFSRPLAVDAMQSILEAGGGSRVTGLNDPDRRAA